MRFLFVFSVLSLVACDAGGPVGTSCSHVSQCEARLQCQLGHCRLECTSDADCAMGGTCLFDGDDPHAPGACTFMAENTCTADSCPDPLVCTPGGCRTPCSEGCRGGTSCVGNVCAAPVSPSDAGAVDASR